MSTNGNRIAIVNPDKCKPKKCNKECEKSCPVVRMGKMCIKVEKQSSISEEMCIGCGICVKTCPFSAIKIINLPDKTLPVSFRYGKNTFQLHSLPQPRQNQVLGIIGANGMGKSTIIKILGDKLKPNFGKNELTSNSDIIKYFRGSELQNYFERLYSSELKVKIKPQHIEFAKGGKKVNEVTKNIPEELLYTLELTKILDRTLEDISGGELQRLGIASVLSSNSDVYIFDEPSNFLDVKQRIVVSKCISNLCQVGKYIIVIEHDLAMLDYISDYITCLYGSSGDYGVVSLPYSTGEGINMYLEGFLPAENMRIRDRALRFIQTQTEEEKEEMNVEFGNEVCNYPEFKIKLGDFTLSVNSGGWRESEIILLLGENGTGKTTLIRTLAGLHKVSNFPEYSISYKPQKLVPKYQGTVRQLLHERIGSIYTSNQFVTDVMKPLDISSLFDNQVITLSGGEIQRVSIALCLGKPADIYLIDEPSSMLDVEMRLSISVAIKRFIRHTHKTAFIVEHDILMGLHLADRVILFEGEPSKNCIANKLVGKEEGFNNFLKTMNVTIRQDKRNKRPRINKLDSLLDREQKKSGKYYSVQIE